MSAPDSVTTIKESFSGPSDILGAAKEAAVAKYGPRNGAWSRWVTDAIRERLDRDGKLPSPENAELAAAADEVGGPEVAVKILQANAPGRTPRKLKRARPQLRRAA